MSDDRAGCGGDAVTRKRMIPIYCTERQIARLDAIASQWGTSRSAAVVKLIGEGIRSLSNVTPRPASPTRDDPSTPAGGIGATAGGNGEMGDG